MLSRVADSLFWMGRYFERAENVARVIDESLFALIDIEHQQEKEEFQYWEPIIRACGDLEVFIDSKTPHATDSVLHFLTFETSNPTSIRSCINRTRENAHRVRDQISEEMWKLVNQLYYLVKEASSHNFTKDIALSIITKVREESLRFQGLSAATYSHGEGYSFLELGKFMERAERTISIIDMKYHIILPSGANDVGGAVDIANWVSILRSCSALDAYLSIYVNEVRPQNVLSLLVTSKRFPRSVLFCISKIDLYLRAILNTPEGQFSNQAEQNCGRLLSSLSYTTTHDIISTGLHEYLVHLKEQVQLLGVAIFDCYMLLPTVDMAEEIQQQQEQQ